MANDLNVWGRGGLFEQAVQSKLANQAAERAKTSSEIGVARQDVDNKYDLGLRGNAVDMQNAQTNSQNADTNRYNAETSRGELAGKMQNPFNAADIQNNGLRTFSAASSPGYNVSGMGSIAPAAPQGYMANSPVAAATNTATPSTTATQSADLSRALASKKMVNGVPTYGFKNGGKVKSMKAMAGYGKGGKVKTMIGCENGGQVEAMGYADSGQAPVARVAPSVKSQEFRNWMADPSAKGHIDVSPELYRELEAAKSAQALGSRAANAALVQSELGRMAHSALPGAALYGAGLAGKAIGNAINDRLSDNAKDVIGGTINQGVRSLGKMIGKDLGVDDTAYLQQKAARGYAKSGKIGDVDNDTGEDTIPAKVRPGEYMLNPETVAHIGGGNYDQGVRHLNQIVRQATGKEPGPTRLGKGEAGFAKSGEASSWQRFKDTAADWTTRARNATADFIKPGTASADAAGATGAGAQTSAGTQAGANASSVRPDAASPEAQAWRAEREAAWANANKPQQGMLGRFKDAVRAGAQEAVDATGASSIAAGSGANAAEQAATAGKILNTVRNSPMLNNLAGLGVLSGAYNTYKGVRDGDYTGATLGAADAASSAVPLLGASAAAYAPAALVYGAGRAGWELGDKVVNPMLSEDTKDVIGGTINEGVRSLGKLFGKDWGVDDSQLLLQRAQQNNPVAAPTKPAAPKEDKAAAPKEDKAAAAEQAAAAAPPSLRDMLLQRYNDLASDTRGQGTLYRQDAMRDIVKSLTDLENNANTTTASTTNAMLKARQDAQDATDKRIAQAFSTPVVDKTGQITSYTQDDVGARAFRENMAQQGIDIYSLPNATQDALAREFGLRYRALKNINQTLVGNGGDQAPVSDVIGAYNIQKGLGLGDVIGNEGVTFGDYLKSLRPWSNDIDNRVVRLPSGDAVSAANAFRTPDGAIDYDAYRAALGDSSKLQQMITAAKAEQAKANK